MILKERSKLIIIFFVFLFAIVVLKTAWLCDDAYITFRTVDNFINGHGLAWNPIERVQTYTHPLWMLLLSILYFFTREIYYSSIILSIVISLVTVLVFAFGIVPSSTKAILGLVILIFSKAFVDYSTSGLENPLTHLLWLIFLFIYLKSDINLKTIWFLSLIAGLATLNRMDTLLLYLPTLVYILIKFRKWRGLAVATAGFLPFILWELFSLFYYGFLFPNTAYAKFNLPINQWELTKRGLYYLQDSLTTDPITLLAIAVGMLIPLIGKTWRNLPIVAGIALYLLYTIRIGGDFMSGRYLTAPLLGAVVLLIDSHLTTPKLIWIPTLSVVVFVGVMSPQPPLLSEINYGLNHETLDARVVEDERAHYYQGSGMFSSGKKTSSLDHSWANKGKQARANGPSVVVKGAIGYFGFYAGPDVYVVNIYGLGDPLLARLSPKFRRDWVVGHFSRRIPHGYLQTLETGENLISEENLAIYYDKLSYIVRGKLFEANRLVEILKFNLGKYDYLLESYPPMLLIDMTGTNATNETISWNSKHDFEQYAGIQIDFDRQYNASRVEFTVTPLDHEPEIKEQNREYYVRYFNGDWQIAVQELTVPLEIEETTVRVVPVPEKAAQEGYDKIQILSKEGDYLNWTIAMVEQIRLLE